MSLRSMNAPLTMKKTGTASRVAALKIFARSHSVESS